MAPLALSPRRAAALPAFLLLLLLLLATPVAVSAAFQLSAFTFVPATAGANARRAIESWSGGGATPVTVLVERAEADAERCDVRELHAPAGVRSIPCAVAQHARLDLAFRSMSAEVPPASEAVLFFNPDIRLAANASALCAAVAAVHADHRRRDNGVPYMGVVRRRQPQRQHQQSRNHDDDDDDAPVAPALLHSPWGKDVFLLRRDALPIVARAMPPFLIGRPLWDDWLLHYALERSWPVYDVTRALPVEHLGADDESSRRRAGAERNRAAYRRADGDRHPFASIDNADFVIDGTLRVRRKRDEHKEDALGVALARAAYHASSRTSRAERGACLALDSVLRDAAVRRGAEMQMLGDVASRLLRGGRGESDGNGDHDDHDRASVCVMHRGRAYKLRLAACDDDTDDSDGGGGGGRRRRQERRACGQLQVRRLGSNARAVPLKRALG